MHIRIYGDGFAIVRVQMQCHVGKQVAESVRQFTMDNLQVLQVAENSWFG